MKNIIKRIIVGVAIALIVSALSGCNVVHAATIKIGGTTLTDSNYAVLNQGNREIGIEMNETIDYVDNSYYLITFCQDAGSISSWYSTSSPYYSSDNIYIYQTKQSCKYPNSTYTGGKIMYVYGQRKLTNERCGATGTNCIGNVYLTFYNPSSASFSLVSFTNMKDAPLIDYGNDTIINLTEAVNSSINLWGERNREAINSQGQATRDAINSQGQATRDAINSQGQATRDFLSDSSIPSNSDYNFDSYNEDNGVITNLLTMPITLIQGMLNGMNNGCTAYNLGTIKGQTISLPCIYPGQHLGIAWNIIDVIMSGIFIFIFGKKCITIFNDVTNMKSNQVDEVFK